MMDAHDSEPTSRRRNLVRAISTLLVGTVGASALNFVIFSLAARALGPTSFGLMTISRTFAMVVGALVSSQVPYALIKFGAEALERGDKRRIASLVKAGFVVDALAIVVGICGGEIALFGFSRALSLPDKAVMPAAIYLVTIAFTQQSVPNAVFRLFNVYRPLATLQIFAATLGAVASVLLYALVQEPFPWMFLATYALVEVTQSTLMVLAALRILRENDVPPLTTVPLMSLRSEARAAGGFVLLNALQSSVKKIVQEADVFIVGALTTTQMVGLYKVPKQLGQLSSKFLEPLYQVLYPELAHHAARRDWRRLRRLIIQAGLISGGVATLVWLIFVIASEPIVRLIAGAAYLPSIAAMHWYLGGLIIVHASLALTRALLVLGRPGTWLAISVITSALYLPGLGFLIQRNGLVGAGQAYLAYNVLFSASLLAAVAWAFPKSESRS